MEGESIKHTHTKSCAERLLISNTAEIKYQIPGLFLPLFSLLFSPHTLGHPQATLSVWRHWKAVSTLKRERKIKRAGGYFSLVLPVLKKGAIKWKRPLAKRADRGVCPSFSPPLKWPVMRAKPSVGLVAGGQCTPQDKAPGLMATPATMKRAVREPHKAWGGFPCSRRLSSTGSGAEGVPHGKAQGLKSSDGSYLTDWSGHGNSTLLFLGVLRGQVRLLRVRTPDTNPPWQAGIESLSSPRALVPQALLPGVACRDGPSALEGRGGTQPGLPVAPAPLHARRVPAAKRAQHQIAQGDFSVPPPLLPWRQARPSLRKRQPGWPLAPLQMLVGSAGRRQGSPFHQRWGACPYHSLAAPRLWPSRQQDELVAPIWPREVPIPRALPMAPLAWGRLQPWQTGAGGVRAPKHGQP